MMIIYFPHSGTISMLFMRNLATHCTDCILYSDNKSVTGSFLIKVCKPYSYIIWQTECSISKVLICNADEKNYGPNYVLQEKDHQEIILGG